jgi:hypothetical protein
MFSETARRLLPIALSIVIGAATHVLWDSVTHHDGWVVQHWPALSNSIRLGATNWEVFDILWYISTIGGIAWLAMAYQKWRGTSSPSRLLASLRVRLTSTVLLTGIGLGLALAHRLVQSISVPSIVWDIAITAASGLLVIGFVWWSEAGEAVRR